MAPIARCRTNPQRCWPACDPFATGPSRSRPPHRQRHWLCPGPPTDRSGRRGPAPCCPVLARPCSRSTRRSPCSTTACPSRCRPRKEERVVVVRRAARVRGMYARAAAPCTLLSVCEPSVSGVVPVPWALSQLVAMVGSPLARRKRTLQLVLVVGLDPGNGRLAVPIQFQARLLGRAAGVQHDRATRRPAGP